jgi:predicted transcriptional regulator
MQVSQRTKSDIISLSNDEYIYDAIKQNDKTGQGQ